MAVKTRVNAKTGKQQELVEVTVNGKNGQYVSHRWRNVQVKDSGTKDPFKTTKKKIKGVSLENAVALFKEFAIQMITKYARDTPVDEGDATANWVVGINKEPPPTKDQDTTKSSNKTIGKARKALEKVDVNDMIIIKNAVRSRNSENGDGYIIKLEMGHSKQAPTGMFRKNNAKAKKIEKRAKKKVGL